MRASTALSDFRRSHSKWDRAARDGHDAASALVECASNLASGLPDSLPQAASRVPGAKDAVCTKLKSRQAQHAERLLFAASALESAASEMRSVAARLEGTATASPLSPASHHSPSSVRRKSGQGAQAHGQSVGVYLCRQAASECTQCAADRRHVAEELSKSDASLEHLKAMFAVWSAAPHMTHGLLDRVETALESERRGY